MHQSLEELPSVIRNEYIHAFPNSNKFETQFLTVTQSISKKKKKQERGKGVKVSLNWEPLGPDFMNPDQPKMIHRVVN